MTNFEYYKDKIFDITVVKEEGLSVVNGKPYICSKTNCFKCDFKNVARCSKLRFEWLYSEHVEQPKLTTRERKLLEVVENGYIARDFNGALWWYTKEPLKGRRTWLFEDGDRDYAKLGYILDCFSFIKWEDEKPWKVEDLLKLEVTE